jgi:hypothetical protein
LYKLAVESEKSAKTKLPGVRDYKTQKTREASLGKTFPLDIAAHTAFVPRFCQAAGFRAQVHTVTSEKVVTAGFEHENLSVYSTNVSTAGFEPERTWCLQYQSSTTGFEPARYVSNSVLSRAGHAST